VTRAHAPRHAITAATGFSRDEALTGGARGRQVRAPAHGRWHSRLIECAVACGDLALAEQTLRLAAKASVRVGLGRTVALYDRSSTLYQVHEHIRRLYF
jgi:hypothetical protein